MSRIGDLVAELAPKGVTFKKLGEVGEFIRGNGLQKSDLADEGIPAIHYGQIHTHYGVWATSTRSFVSPELGSKLRRAQPGDLVIATTSEDDEAVAKATAWIGDREVAVSGDAYIYRHELDPRYVAYFFQSEHFQRQKKRHVTGTKVRRLSGDSLAKLRVPVPPLDVQREIVRILDNFTELEAELEAELSAELQARCWQYMHYRESLLTFPAREEVRWITMGEAGAFTRGRRFTKSDMVSEGIPSIHYGEIYTHYGAWATTTVSHVRAELAPSLRFAHTGDVVIAAVGETVDDVCKAVAWLGEENVAVHDDCFIFRHSMNPRFVSYYLQTDAFRAEKAKHVARAKVKRVSGEGLARLRIPVPPLDEQERIVAILDEFIALVNHLSNDLPAELNTRRRQYEHCRDRLLTFVEAA